MCPTKERNLRSSERTKPVVYIRRDVHSGDSVPRPLGFIALMPIPVNQIRRWGSVLSPNPSLVLAPESVLSLLPSRGLSSARSLVVYPQQ